MVDTAKGNKKKMGVGGGVLCSCCLCHARHIPHLCRLHPNPCNLLALRQGHRTHTPQLQCSRKTKTPRCKRLCPTNASSSKRLPPTALLMAPDPSQRYFFNSSRKHTASQHSTSFTVLLRSDQSAVYSSLPPCPHKHYQSTPLASQRLRSQNTG